MDTVTLQTLGIESQLPMQENLKTMNELSARSTSAYMSQLFAGPMSTDPKGAFSALKV